MISKAPLLGTAEVNPSTGAYSYTPSQNIDATDSFQISVYSDKLLGTATVSVAIKAVDDSLKIECPTLRAVAGQRIESALNIYTISKGPFKVEVRGAPSQGTLLWEDLAFTYVPVSSSIWSSGDSFSVQVTDGKKTSNICEVRVSLNDPNTPPVAQPETVTTAREQPVLIGVVVSDTETPNILDLVIKVGSAQNGDAYLSNPEFGLILKRYITYVPKTGFVGTDSFTYTVVDAAGKESAPATISVTVTPTVPGSSDASFTFIMSGLVPDVDPLPLSAEGYLGISRTLLPKELNDTYTDSGPGTLVLSDNRFIFYTEGLIAKFNQFGILDKSFNKTGWMLTSSTNLLTGETSRFRTQKAFALPNGEALLVGESPLPIPAIK